MISECRQALAVLGSHDASLVNEGNDEHDDDEKVAGVDVGGESDAYETGALAEGASAHCSGGGRAGA